MFDQLQQALDKRSKVEGVTASDVMQMPEPLRGLVNKMMRKGSTTASELAAELHLQIDQARQIAERLVEKGVLSAVEREADGERVYRARLAHTRRLSAPPDLYL